VKRALRAAQENIKKAEQLLDLIIKFQPTSHQKRRLVRYGEQDADASAKRIFRAVGAVAGRETAACRSEQEAWRNDESCACGKARAQFFTVVGWRRRTVDAAALAVAASSEAGHQGPPRPAPCGYSTGLGP
jgi:hypothetical protein